MAAPFEDLPVEIVEKVVCLLDLPDAGNLRLVSGALAAKSSQGSFKRYFVSKSVDLTRRSLEDFVRVTEAGSLGSLVEEITLVGIVWDTEYIANVVRDRSKRVTESTEPRPRTRQVELDDAAVADAAAELKVLREREVEAAAWGKDGGDVDFLRQAFGNLVRNGKDGGLKSLKTEVVVYRETSGTRSQPIEGGKWDLIWDAAAYAFRTVMRALAGSGLQVEELCLFGRQQRCSVASHELDGVDFGGAEMRKCLAALERSSLSFSLDFGSAPASEAHDDPCDGKRNRSQEHATPLSEPPANTLTGLPTLLQNTPQLQDLHLHFYSTTTKHEQRNTERQMLQVLFHTIAQTAPLTNLRTCRLRNLTASETSLLTFLQSSPLLSSLQLEEIHLLDPGSFAPVLEYLANEASNLIYLHLDTLWEKRLLYFEGEVGMPYFPSRGTGRGPNWVIRVGSEAVKRVVRARVSLGRPLGSPQAVRWRETRRREFGPP
ncbi:hypothetical protein EJ03DRAFT_351757 [Teratosphaeria nubilosa]|uniref:F-box domain-containing protein n=1 Tax=Teratosphaeria nubilosa TaxID=161662 RepID=A0A6G1L920_9PEZI|nr:hypothetical protein EJ03DRAFT_351757 [Teratosphaeria nubilosa]